MKENRLKLITKILAILIICLISFAGVYVQNENSKKMTNGVIGYKLSKDLQGYRQIVLEVSDATKVLDKDGKLIGNTDDYSDSSIESNEYTKTSDVVNTEDVLNVENYQICRDIIEAKLNNFKLKEFSDDVIDNAATIQDYNISVNKENGLIYIQIPETSKKDAAGNTKCNYTDYVVSTLTNIGGLELRDSETDEVFLTEEHVKNVEAICNNTGSGAYVYLQIEFDKFGTDKLKELTSGEYATVEDEKDEAAEEPDKEENEGEATEESNKEEKENSEDKKSEENSNKEKSEDETSEENDEDEDEEKKNQKELALYISGREVITQSFDEPLEDGKIALSINNKAMTDVDTIDQYLYSVSTTATILNSGKMPILYKVQENQYVASELTNNETRNIIIITATIVIMLIALAYMIIKHKASGFLSAISFIGFVATYLLLLRLANVTISLEGIVSIGLILVINYLFNMLLLKNKQDEKKKLYKEVILKMVPIFAISIIFTLVGWGVLNSFGMCMFWGIILLVVYNWIVTNKLID